MDNRILTAEGWQQRIRDIMGVDAAYLPNFAIEQPEVITMAEANVIAQLPDYSTLQDDAKVYLEAAVVCECAQLLCPSMPVRLPSKESGPHESHELSLDWEERQKQLETDRDKYVGKVKEMAFPDLLPLALFHFTVTNPVRW
jgi:hypothetical protein